MIMETSSDGVSNTIGDLYTPFHDTNNNPYYENISDVISVSARSHTMTNLTSSVTSPADIVIEPWCQDLQSNDLLYTATHHTTPLRQIVAVVFLILLILTVVGNAFVILVVIIDRRLRRITSGLIVSMALADVLVALSLELHGVIMVFDQSNDHLSSFMCELSISIDIYFALCELLHLTCLAVERYLAICHPFLYERCGKKFLILIIILAWTVPLVFSFLPILTMWHTLRQDDIYQCMESLRIDRCVFFPNRIFSSVLFFVMFVLPTMLLLFCYTKILQVALTHRRRIDTQTTLGSYCESQPEIINSDQSNSNNDGIPKSKSMIRESSTDEYLNMINFDARHSSPEKESTVKYKPQRPEESPFIVNTEHSKMTSSIKSSNSSSNKLNSIKVVQPKSTKIYKKQTPNLSVASCDSSNRTKWHSLCRAIFGIDDFFRTSRSIVYVCISFLLTWTPYWTLMLISPFIGPQCIPKSAVLVAISLFSLGTAVNPFVYYFCNTDVRRGIFRVVKRICFKVFRCEDDLDF